MDINNIEAVKMLLAVNEYLIKTCLNNGDFRQIEEYLQHRTALKDHLISLYEEAYEHRKAV